MGLQDRDYMKAYYNSDRGSVRIIKCPSCGRNNEVSINIVNNPSDFKDVYCDFCSTYLLQPHEQKNKQSVVKDIPPIINKPLKLHEISSTNSQTKSRLNKQKIVTKNPFRTFLWSIILFVMSLILWPFVYFFVPKRYKVDMSDGTHRYMTIEEISFQANVSIDEVRKLYERIHHCEGPKWLVNLYNKKIGRMIIDDEKSP